MTVALLNQKVTPPIKRLVGKHYLTEEMISLLPNNHKVYVELFGGGGHILTQKHRSKFEVYNDNNCDLVNFLMVLRSRKEELITRLETLMCSRFSCQEWEHESLPDDELNRAAVWYSLLVQRSSPSNANSLSRWGVNKKLKFVADYQNSVQALNEFQERWSNVMIECVDFRRIIDIYDAPDTVFVVEPPYVGREGQYTGVLSHEDHVELAALLRNIQGKAIVTYSECDLVNTLYKDWTRIERTECEGPSMVSENTNLKTEKEIIFMNYEEEQMSLF